MFLYLKLWGAITAGIASHSLFFIRGEYHLKAPSLLLIYLASYVLLLFKESKDGFQLAVRNVTLIINAYVFALFASMVIYRTAFHPLRAFPGPVLARVSKLWHVYMVRGSQNHLVLEGMRENYGTFVRTGPSEITVFEPGIFTVIGGPGAKCTKSAWYDMLSPLIALNSIREKEGYALRRRLWDEAFKPKALQSDEDKIFKYSRRLERHIWNSDGQPLNVCDWFSFFSFDVMGELGFAKSFDMLESGRWHHAVKLLRDGMAILGLVTPVPWLAQICFRIPGAASSWNSMIKWCKETMAERVAIEVEKPDVSYWFIEAARKKESFDLSMNDLYGDAVAVIIAGSHTVATTLVYLFYQLAMNPHIQTRLRGELATIPSLFQTRSLKDLHYLEAVINETLRLHPVLPTGGIRQTGREGIFIAAHYIPPYTMIVAPRYSISRLESCFERANEFIPERWTDRPEMVKDKRAFNPFNLGRHLCPGKNFGLMELRIVTAMLVMRFDISLAPFEDGTAVLANMKDTFTAQPGKLELVFKRRSVD